ncbi:hypothetical protein [uncultured Acidaminococcus sp.]|uniref:hypothetical protein n=1 Tax=uncultured Acidaminococcus sp. TaxID=352152 RepID=UPI0025E7B4BB|nr:hypothetical protein [uncultured Acidaminococcus sp.]
MKEKEEKFSLIHFGLRYGTQIKNSPCGKRPLPIPAEAFSRKEVVYDDLMGKIAARRGDPCYKKKYSPNSCQRKGADLNSL